jgi:hypothetical protein
MHELVTLEQFNGVMRVVALAGLPLGAALGALLAALTRDRLRLAQGPALGLLGPLAGLAWLLFRWTVRIDPATHYVGLYRPGVLALDVVVFLAAGVGLGLLYRRVFRRS